MKSNMGEFDSLAMLYNAYRIDRLLFMSTSARIIDNAVCAFQDHFVGTEQRTADEDVL